MNVILDIIFRNFRTNGNDGMHAVLLGKVWMGFIRLTPYPNLAQIQVITGDHDIFDAWRSRRRRSATTLVLDVSGRIFC